jgi:predicted Zn-dependent protease
VGCSGAPLIDERGRAVAVAVAGWFGESRFCAVSLRWLPEDSGASPEALDSWFRRTAGDPRQLARRDLEEAVTAAANDDPAGVRTHCEAALRRGVLSASDSERAAEGIGYGLYSARHPDAAVARVKQIAAAHPRDAWAQRALCSTLSLVKRPEEALAAADEALRLDPTDRSHVLQRTCILMDLDRPAEAEAVARKGIAGRPDDPALHDALARVFLRGQKRAADAVAPAREAVRLAPAVPEFRMTLAGALVESGRLDEGVVEFEEIVRIAPRLLLVHENLARVHSLRDDPQGVAREMAIVRDIDPKAADALAKELAAKRAAREARR